ncbi:hypothetical protein VF_1045 [Aliivibrio fischeri ES114]|uniref:Uncharacterized protein n=2 Tax=Aliivibrio fischeri TaxID=668 RepID=Q5E606_ALIF1|nr:retron Ec48 family effector membrane protein [Aliivibrio fischeri]AAW85540.1 hypothetical protein VF_1045 [Aliivibrio fischeri ES114]KLU80182.1 hypothetical protein AB192_05710 [Aliivibrio fischeri]
MMIKIINSNKALRNLVFIFIFVGAIGLLLSLLSIIMTMLNNETYNLNVCLTSSCMKYTYGLFEYSLKIINITITCLTSIATIGGIFVALLSYVSTSNSSALNNHISHFKIFNDYLVFEISKSDRLNVSAIDIFKLYNLIFSSSRSGNMDVSKQYKQVVESLNQEINNSNQYVQEAEPESFRYKNHQVRMISRFESFGIQLNFHPRNDFYEIEGQLLELISTINQAFCTDSMLPNIVHRKYI